MNAQIRNIKNEYGLNDHEAARFLARKLSRERVRMADNRLAGSWGCQGFIDISKDVERPFSGVEQPEKLKTMIEKVGQYLCRKRTV